MRKTNEQIAIHVSIVTIIGNVVLSVFKLTAGVLGNSTAMVSDAVHSISDVFSTVVVIIGAKLTAKESDDDHPYGHERLECVCAAILAVMLGVTGIGIGVGAARIIVSGEYISAEAPGAIALLAAIISIVTKEWMYWYTRAAGKKISSGALMADAWHHRSDALSSIGSFVGILGAQLGILVLDSVAGLIISILILKVAFDILRDALNKMTDKACSDEIINQISNITETTDGVLNIDSLKTRMFGERVYTDIEIAVQADISVSDAHEIAQTVHDEIETNIPIVKHCMVHVNPLQKK